MSNTKTNNIFNNCIKHTNLHFLVLFLFSVLCLLVMHWQLAATIDYEYNITKITLLGNLFSCFFDATSFFLIGMLFTMGRTKKALLASFIISIILSYCNILYSRFFGHYIPNTAITQIGNLNDQAVIKSIFTGIKLHDIYIIVLAILFTTFYIKTNSTTIKNNAMRTLGIIWCPIVTLIFLTILIMLPLYGNLSIEQSFYEFFPVRAQYNLAPNTMVLRGGFVRRVIVCHNDFFRKDMELDKRQIEDIEGEYTNNSYRMTNPTINHDIKNIIFIVVESYLSTVSDLKVDNKEITPFLNSLKLDSSVYYNGNMISDINLGESSDGQFIYMTGLLPLKSDITVNIAKNKTLNGFPKLLSDNGRIKNSHIIVPTAPTFWEQDAMNDIYGICKLYSKYDYKATDVGNKDLNDEQIFAMASEIDTATQEPFFSMILTMSMHNPYYQSEENDFVLSDPKLTKTFKNYLIDCHYFDIQIAKYLSQLKKHGIYDRSLIIIAADHQAHPSFFDMKEGEISDYLPLYIINGGIDKSKAWTGEFHQLDVYTTLLDILGIDSKWRGFGHTLLRSDYKPVEDEKAQTLSEWIIRGNYFSKSQQHP